ncbi:SDR family NAD(P)-dependent oxidoreductase [Pseudoponticoccus marisrubri]|nr:SDR family NAD(P)-dependent oxidoreductase [Pseudoponticoccus marisrubri]
MSARTILITGCSSGIGFAAATALRAQGWTVFAACRQEADCIRLREMGFASPRIDYADAGSIATGLSEVLEATGGTLDALFNNGAYALPGATEDIPTQALREVFEAGVFGWHELTRRVIPVMRAQGHGRIVNHSSVLGLVVAPWRGPYNATKFAIEALTSTLRIEMRDTPIHVITLNTGPIPTRIRANSIPHFERWVDWKASPRAEQYRKRLIPRLYDSSGKADPFQLPPVAVTEKLLHALEAPTPAPRYHVTGATVLMHALRRGLPTRWLEALIAQDR